MADTTTTPTNPGQKPLSSEMESILAPLRQIAKYKARSHDTSKDVHIPHLESQTKDAPGPTVVLVGDSMFERMTTTGESPNFPAPWPSPSMLSDETLTKYDSEDKKTERLTRVFNAGVGGDKIQNIAYRLVGDEEKGLPGLLPMLAECGTVKLWVVQAGTNNLSPKKGLRREDANDLERLVRTLLGVKRKDGKECRVLVTGLFYRKDVSNNLVDQANEQLKQVTKILEDRCRVGRLGFSLPWEVQSQVLDHLVDHVHMNLEGYQLWTEKLFLAVVGWLRTMEDSEEAVEQLRLELKE